MWKPGGWRSDSFTAELLARVMASMQNSAETHAPVVIVGGGPVGMGLAIDLGLRGVRSIVVERYKDPQPIPRDKISPNAPWSISISRLILVRPDQFVARAGAGDDGDPAKLLSRAIGRASRCASQ
jgi:hypothetical protein